MRVRRADVREGAREGSEVLASHNTPIVAAETGLPGLALLTWLVFAALVLSFRRNPVATETGRARLGFGLALVAIAVHSLFYNALLEDPLFWSLLGLAAVAAREDATPVAGTQ